MGNPRNPTGKGGFKPGVSGNPSGRPRRQIENLANEARKLTGLAMETLEAICRGTIKGCTPRDRLAAANAILDRGHGKPIAPVDLLTINRKVEELSDADFAALDARLVAAGIISADDHADEAKSCFRRILFNIGPGPDSGGSKPGQYGWLQKPEKSGIDALP